MWNFEYDVIKADLGTAVFYTWKTFREKKIYPRAGGWEDQSLAILIQMAALDLTYETWTYQRSEGADWRTLSPIQKRLIKAFQNGE